MELADWHRWWKERGSSGVRRLLMDDWDPIGVAQIPEAVDEYDAYVGVVGRMLHEGAAAEELESYLRGVREDHMGLGPSPSGREGDSEVARRLTAWYASEMA